MQDVSTNKLDILYFYLESSSILSRQQALSRYSSIGNIFARNMDKVAAPDPASRTLIGNVRLTEVRLFSRRYNWWRRKLASTSETAFSKSYLRH